MCLVSVHQLCALNTKNLDDIAYYFSFAESPKNFLKLSQSDIHSNTPLWRPQYVNLIIINKIENFFHIFWFQVYISQWRAKIS